MIGPPGKYPLFSLLAESAVTTGTTALIASTIEGATSYVVAFRVLGIKRASAFDRLTEELGLSSVAAVARS